MGDPHKPPRTKKKGSEHHRQRMVHNLLTRHNYDMEQRSLLEMLLYYSIPRADTRDMSVDLMEKCGNNIENVLTADMDTLTSVPGVGNVSASMLRLMGAAISRIQPSDGNFPGGVSEDHPDEDSADCTDGDTDKDTQ